jgi:hypothetical protein
LNLHWLNKLFVLIVFISKAFSFGEAFSQSYISNGDFETLMDCPKFWSVKGSDFLVEDWCSPTKATPDVYSKCSKDCNTLSNWMDGSMTDVSNGYIGIITRQNGKDYSEYVQSKLVTSLNPGSFYKIRMRIYWPKNASFNLVKIGVLLSENKITTSNDKFIEAKHAYYSNIQYDTLRNSTWYNIEIDIKANGKEKYITLGSFERESSFLKKEQSKYDYNYCFIDDFSIEPFDYVVTKSPIIISPNVKSSVVLLDDLTETHLPSNCTCWNCQILNGLVDADVKKLEELEGFELKKGQRIDLNRIIFDYQNGEVLPESNVEMNRLMFVLEEQPKAELRFVIYTYASNESGKVIANESALAIYKFLKNKGLKNSFSYIHAVKESLSHEDGIPRDRNIELFVVNNN